MKKDLISSRPNSAVNGHAKKNVDSVSQKSQQHMDLSLISPGKIEDLKGSIMFEERWRRIGDLNYHVSDQGRVRSRRGILKYRVIRGRKMISLGKDSTSTSIHRLVAKAFIPNPNDYPLVRFKDGDLMNCHWTNLEWVPRPSHPGICKTCKLPKPIEQFGVIHSRGSAKYRYHDCTSCRNMKAKQREFEKILNHEISR